MVLTKVHGGCQTMDKYQGDWSWLISKICKKNLATDQPTARNTKNLQIIFEVPTSHNMCTST